MAAPYTNYDAPPYYNHDHRHIDNHTPSYYSYSDDDDQDDPNSLDARNSRTAQYIDGLDPNADPPSKEDQRHFANGPALPVLKIRRHTPGSSDPLLQDFPSHLEAPAVANAQPLSNVNVTIKRHPIEVEQPIMKPVPYPVPVYANPPILQYPMNPPMSQYPMNPAMPQYPMNPTIPQYPVNPAFQYIQPMQPIQLIQPVQPVQSVQSVQPVEPVASVKEIVRTPSPKKSTTPVKTPSQDRFVAESFQLPPSRNRTNNIIARKPIRTELITPAPSIMKQRKVVPDEYFNEVYEEYYETPPNYVVPEKTVSYRPAAGMTTRELENYQMANRGQSGYVRPPKKQTVTYRKS